MCISESTPPTEKATWREERLRYRILHAVYGRAGIHCERTVTSSEIGAALDLRYEDLFRVLEFLRDQRYLEFLGPGPRVCITGRGIHYIEENAARRRSLRVPEGRAPDDTGP